MKQLPAVTRFHRKCLALAVAVLMGTSASVLGGTISIAPSYVQSFDGGMNSLGALPGAGATTPVGGYLQYEFRMTLDNLAPDEDFWTAIFNIQLGPGLAAGSEWLDPGTAQLNGFYPASPSLSSFDSNGPTPGGSQFHWQFGNDDFGVNPNDLQTIIVEVSPEEAANRQYGELIRPAAGSPDGLGSPTLIGAILVQRTSFVASSISVIPINGSAWGTYVGNGQGNGELTSQPGTTFQSSTVLLAVPEPSSVALSVLGLIAFVTCGRRRHSK